jgi:ABC-type uncharacterized transport system substrate-binding protein
MSGKILIWLLATALLTTAPLAEAQQPTKVHRIGILTGTLLPHQIDAFRLRLREYGWIEGINIVIEVRSAEGKGTDRQAELAAELVRLKEDVIVTSTTNPALQAQKATRTIPIIMVSSTDPVGAGLVTSLARPGENITGLASMSPEISGKGLELLKEVVPKLSRVAVLANPTITGNKLQLKEMEVAAKALRLQLQLLEVGAPSYDFDSAFEAATEGRAGALAMVANPQFSLHRKRIVDLALKKRLPTMSQYIEITEAGGLMSYAVNYTDMWRRAATYVDRILKGAKPADLPVEQPTKFELVVNLKTAKQIGLTIPQRCWGGRIE